MKKTIFLGSFAAITALLLAACGESKVEGDGPTFGKIKVSVDETFAPIIDSQLMVFHKVYERAHIDQIVGSEAEAINALLQDSVRNAIVSRELKPDEMEFLTKQGYKPRQLHIATDAIAVITNLSNPDSSLTMEQLGSITSGKITDWSGVSKRRSGKIQVVFDNPNSSTVRYITDSLNKGAKLPDNVFATKTNVEVINYVAKTPNAIGFIGVSWVSSSTDTTKLSFLSKIKVLGIQPEQGKLGYGEPWLPFQAYIALKYYPLRRNIYSICREARVGLGTGFASWLASDRGQRIIYKAGLIPATMPQRIIKIRKKGKDY